MSWRHCYPFLFARCAYKGTDVFCDFLFCCCFFPLFLWGFFICLFLSWFLLTVKDFFFFKKKKRVCVVNVDSLHETNFGFSFNLSNTLTGLKAKVKAATWNSFGRLVNLSIGLILSKIQCNLWFSDAHLPYVMMNIFFFPPVSCLLLVFLLEQGFGQDDLSTSLPISKILILQFMEKNSNICKVVESGRALSSFPLFQGLVGAEGREKNKYMQCDRCMLSYICCHCLCTQLALKGIVSCSGEQLQQQVDAKVQPCQI